MKPMELVYHMEGITLLIAAVLALLLCSGCATNPLLAPSDHLINRSVGPEYLSYVENDPDLTDLDKRIRRTNVAIYRRLLETYRKEVVKDGN